MAAFIKHSRFSRKACRLLLLNRQSYSERLMHLPVFKLKHRTQIPSNLYMRYLTTSTATVTTRQQQQQLPQSTNAPGVLPAERLLEKLDRNVRRFGRVSERDVQDIIEQVHKDGMVTNRECLMLIQCLGSMMPELHPDRRLELVKQVWSQLKNYGAEYTVQHYNAILRVYLQNSHHFIPTDFLAEMEQNGIVPNRITYQRLIAGYCATGDISGASQILEHMKKEGLPVNEQVFVALIAGNFKANDVENAKEMMSLMKVTGIEPTGDSYAALLSGYAEKGDLDAIRETLKEAEREEIHLHSSVYFDVIFTLTLNGHEQQVPEMLSQIPKTRGYNQDAVSCVLQLMAHGHIDLAYEIFLTMSQVRVRDSEDSTMGRFFIRGLVKNEVPIETLEKYITQMNSAGMNKDNISNAAHFAYLGQQSDYALMLIDCMKKQGLLLRSHLFWPALVIYGKQQNKEKFLSTLRTMCELGDSQDDALRALHNYIVPALLKMGETAQSAAAEIKNVGISQELANLGVIIHLLEDVSSKEACQFMQENKCMVVPIALKPALVQAYRRDQDLSSLIQILSLSKVYSQSSSRELCGLFLYDFCNNAHASPAVIEELIATMSDEGLIFYQEFSNDIRSFLNSKNLALSVETMQLLNNLGMSTATSSAPIERIGDMNIEELEAVLQKNPQNKTIKKFLLSKYCIVGDLTKADALKTELDSLGFVYPEQLLRQLAFMEATHRQNIDAALYYIDEIEGSFPEFTDYVRALLKTVSLLVREGRNSDALSRLEKYASKHGTYLKESQRLDSAASRFERDCGELMTAAAKHQDMSFAKSLMQTLFDKGFVKRGSSVVLEAYVQSYVDSGDIDGAISAMEEVITDYRQAVVLDPLLQTLIQLEDPTRLQKVVDLVTPLFGEMNVLHHLLVSFVHCGHIKKARKILATPGLRAIMSRLQAACETFIRNRQFHELEQLVDVSRDLFAVDRDEMLFQLIRAYSISPQDWVKALNVLTMYEEEGIQPRPRTLRYLAKALRNDGQAVPFDVPPAGAKEFDSALPAMSSSEAEAFRLIQQGAFRKVLELKKKMETTGETLSSTFLSDFAGKLLNRKMNQEFTSLVRELGNVGDVESLLQIQNSDLSTRNVITHIKRHLFIAYVKSNRGEEVLDYLDKNPNDKMDYIGLAGIKALASMSPALLPRLEQMAASTGNVQEKSFLLNNFWSYYICNDQTSEAEHILQRFPILLSHLRVVDVCIHLSENNQEVALQSIATLMRGRNQHSLVMTYNYLIGMHCKNNDSSAATEVVEQAKADGISVQSLRPQVIAQLKTLLTDNFKTIPWADDVQSNSEGTDIEFERAVDTHSSDSDSAQESTR